MLGDKTKGTTRKKRGWREGMRPVLGIKQHSANVASYIRKLRRLGLFSCNNERRTADRLDGILFSLLDR